MSPAERPVRYSKIQGDRAISQAYSRLVADSLARRTFSELLGCVRERSARILGAPFVDGHHFGVEALFNLSRFADAHVRSIASWSGSGASWRAAVRSLAQHLLGQYNIPGFLSAAWDRSRLRPMILELPRQEALAAPLIWEFRELTSSAELREGVALQHCVASYSHRCWRGTSRIWSLRSKSDSKVRPVITIEVDPKTNAIVQARGFRNRPPSGKALQLLQRWQREKAFDWRCDSAAGHWISAKRLCGPNHRRSA